MNKVNPIRLEKVKIALLQDKSYTQAMRQAGYSENVSKQGKARKVIQQALIENKLEMVRQGMDVEKFVEEFLWGLEQTKHIPKLADCLRQHAIYLAIVARHYLPDKIEAKINNVTEEEETILNRLSSGN